MVQGYAVHAAGAELHGYKYEPGPLRPFEVEIAISHCGVGRSDTNLIDNDWGVTKYPFIPGHELIGAVAEVGANVAHLKTGDRVGVGWQAWSCGYCTPCRRGEENLCAEAQPTCVGRNGGFADTIRVDARFAVPIPAALDSATAAPLLSSGVTVYQPLRRHGIHPASRVGIIGIGGLGHLALQFARAFGAEVTAFSSTADKEGESRRLGAHQFINTRESKLLKALAGRFDLLLSTVNAEVDWNPYVQALRLHGALVFTGSLPKPISLATAPLLSCMRGVSGANTGSPIQIAEMLEVAARHGIGAVVEPHPMREANLVVERVRKGLVRFRAVLAN